MNQVEIKKYVGDLEAAAAQIDKMTNLGYKVIGFTYCANIRHVVVVTYNKTDEPSQKKVLYEHKIKKFFGWNDAKEEIKTMLDSGWSVAGCSWDVVVTKDYFTVLLEREV